MTTPVYETYRTGNETESPSDIGIYRVVPRDGTTYVSPPHSEIPPRAVRQVNTPLESESPYVEPSKRQSTDEALPYSTNEIIELRGQIEFVRAERDRLSDELLQLRQMRQSKVAQAVGNEISLFILSKVVEAGVLSLDILTQNLEAPVGWLALGELWRAELIECHGTDVFATEVGCGIVEFLEQRSQRK